MSRIRLALSIAILPASLIALVWGVWPGPRQTASLEVQPGAMALSGSTTRPRPQMSTPDIGRASGGGNSIQPTSPALTWIAPPLTYGGTVGARSTPVPASSFVAIRGAHRVSLAYPAFMRSGDFYVVSLSLAADVPDDVTAIVSGNVPRVQTAETPDPYDTHNVIAEAQLDVPGLEIRPSASVSEPQLPGRGVSFFWSVHAMDAGTYDGTAWLFLVFVDKTTGAHSRNAISAQSLHMPATQLFGLGGNAARGLGGIGCLVGGVVGFPFVEDILEWFWRRIQKRS